MAKHELPALPYTYDALEPFIDAKTMEIHHAKHHATYVEKLNEALGRYPELDSKTLWELLDNPEMIPDDIQAAVRNHGGGHLNHSLFWRTMKPVKDGGGQGPQGKVLELINTHFGSYAGFREEFTKSAIGIFGSGWAWLVAEKGTDKLSVITLPNQDSPLMKKLHPMLGLDVWEHAYYLKHQNRRAEYVEAWWSVVNWDEVEKNFGV